MPRIGNIIKAITKYKGLKMYQVAALTGKAPNTLVAMLNRGNLQIREAIKILDVLGYEMVVQKKRTGKKLPGEINITSDQEEYKAVKDEIFKRLNEQDGKTSFYYRVYIKGGKAGNAEKIQAEEGRQPTIQTDDIGEYIDISTKTANTKQDAEQIAQTVYRIYKVGKAHNN